jgi:hypothetical protein
MSELSLINHVGCPALFYTNNTSAELATAWIFENPNADLETPLELEINEGKGTEGFSDFLTQTRISAEMFKMVFVVREEQEENLLIKQLILTIFRSILDSKWVLARSQLK